MRISDGSSDVCSSDLVAARVMGLIGFGDRADLATFAGRIAARDEIDARMAEWCGARPLAEVLDAFESAEAAAAPVYSMAAIATRSEERPVGNEGVSTGRCRRAAYY